MDSHTKEINGCSTIHQFKYLTQTFLKPASTFLKMISIPRENYLRDYLRYLVNSVLHSHIHLSVDPAILIPLLSMCLMTLCTTTTHFPTEKRSSKSVEVVIETVLILASVVGLLYLRKSVLIIHHRETMIV